jgi:hypothetical protein
MKDLAPEYSASRGDGFLAAAELRFTMAPRFFSTMPGSTRRVMYTVDVTLSSSRLLTWYHHQARQQEREG